jgi:Protein of unknown function (DUF3631)
MENEIGTGVDAAGMDIDGAALLDNICAFIQCYVAVSEAQVRVIALWAVHTHAFSAADCTPYMAITSPEKRSGKTRLLEVLETIVANPWLTGRVTAAVLYRKIEAQQPSLLLDESDAAFNSEREYAEALRGVLNTGHRRGGKTSCCIKVSGDNTWKDYSTFCPKVIAGIGRLPDTVADRAIPIRLKRAARGEVVERFRRRDVEPVAAELGEMMATWCSGIVERLRDAHVGLPEELTDRQQDGAEPLLAIADAAGGHWPQLARSALVTLCAEARKSDESMAIRLLSDLRQIFNERRVDRLSSADLVKWLARIETSPWAEWKGEKPITPPKVASLLDGFDIQPHSIRVKDKVLRGYDREDFKDAWKRYLGPSQAEWLDTVIPPPQSATPLQANTGAGSGDFQTATDEAVVAAQKRQITSKNAGCSGVAVRKPRRRRKLK